MGTLRWRGWNMGLCGGSVLRLMSPDQESSQITGFQPNQPEATESDSDPHYPSFSLDFFDWGWHLFLQVAQVIFSTLLPWEAPSGRGDGKEGAADCRHKSSRSRDMLWWSWPRKVKFSPHELTLQNPQLRTLAVLCELPLRLQKKKKEDGERGGSHPRQAQAADAALADTEKRWEGVVFYSSFFFITTINKSHKQRDASPLGSGTSAQVLGTL